MTPATASQRVKEETTPVKKRRLISRLPIWVRVSVITALVLVGVLLSTMLLAGVGGGVHPGGHGSGGRMQMEMNHDGSRGDHGSGRDRGPRDHGSAPHTRSR
jgi:hypothetical protein